MKKLYRGPYIDAFCQVWFHLVQLFQRSRLKYEKLTDGRRTTDAKWWQYLTWPFGSGELKRYSQRQKGTANGKKVQPKTKRYSQRQKGTANGKKVQPKTQKVQPKTKRYSQRQKGTAKGKKVQPKTKRYSQRQKGTANGKKVQPKTKKVQPKTKRYSQRQKGTAEDKKVQPKAKKNYGLQNIIQKLPDTYYWTFLVDSISYISSISNLCSNLLNTNKIYFHNKTRFRKHHIYNMQ